MNLDSLKQAWHTQQFNAPEPAEPKTSRIRSYTAKLSRRFGRTAIVGFIMSAAIWWMNELLDQPLWLVVAESVFFALMGVVQGSMWLKISEADLGRMTVQGAIEWVVSVRKGIVRRIALGLTLAIPLLCVMLWNFLEQDMMLFVSGCIGLVIGAAIGYAKWRQNMWCIRQMERELEPFADTERS